MSVFDIVLKHFKNQELQELVGDEEINEQEQDEQEQKQEQDQEQERRRRK